MPLFKRSSNIHLIGRDQERQEIQKYASDKGTQKIYLLQAPGGVGKTRILEEVDDLLRETPDLLIAKIIDFDDAKNSITLYLASAILDAVGQSATFHSWLDRESEKLTKAGTLSSEADFVAGDLSATINGLTLDKRVILRFDTFEKLPMQQRGQLLTWLAGFKNVFVIIASRPAPDPGNANADLIRDDIKTDFGHDAKIRPLKTLSHAAAREFLFTLMPELDSPHNATLVKSLVSLTERRPILLALTVEWLVRKNPPAWLTRPGQIPPGNQDPSTEFKKLLVQHINQIRDPMDRLVHVLSWVYPLDIEMAQVMLALSRQEAIALFHEALTYFFIKLLPDDRITLHDEMRDMVEKLVWPDLPDRERLGHLYSMRAYQAIKPKLAELDAKIDAIKPTNFYDFKKNTLLAEREQYLLMGLQHLFTSDPRAGYLEILDQVNSDRDAVKLGRRLLDLAKPYRRRASADEKFRFDLTDTRVASKEESPAPERAKARMLRWLQVYAADPLYSAHTKNALARLEIQLANLDDALRYQLDSYAYVEKHRADERALVANQIGYIYRLKRDLDNALHWYKLALDLAQQLDPLPKPLIAGILNNLGYAQGLSEFEDQAHYNCQTAIDLWLATSTPRLAGRAYNTLGILARDREAFDESLHNFQRALDLFREPDDREEICRSLFHRGWTLWFKWENRNLAQIFRWEQTHQADFAEMKTLEDARESFEQSQRYAESYQLNHELPGIFHQMSNVYWWLGNANLPHSADLVRRARSTNQRARLLSAKYHDVRYAIDSLVGDAEYDFDSRNHTDIFRLGKELRQTFENYETDFALYFGRMERIEADVYFEDGKFKTAKQLYARGLGKLSAHGGYGRYSIESELERLDLRIKQLKRPEAQEWISDFRTQWSQLPATRPNGDPSARRIRGKQKLLAWCEGQLVKVAIRED